MSIRPIESYVEQDFDRSFYPEGDDLQKFVDRRNRNGRIWYLIFIASTIVAIVALTALLYTIIRDSFGYIVIQNTVDPAKLVQDVEQARMLSAPNTVSSEDDTELVKGIQDNPYAIGYFGYAYYANNQDILKAVPVNGSVASAETVRTGAYPYVRPLYIYSAPEVMQAKSSVSDFVNYYLANAEAVMAEVGYFPPNQEAFQQARETWLEINNLNTSMALPPVDPTEVPDQGVITISGSSTVYPVTRQIAINFRQAGYPGGLKVDQVGTTAGFEQFCAKDGIDIVDASNPAGRTQFDACTDVQRELREFTVGTDALAIAVSQKNDFLKDVTVDQLREIFTDYERWSEVDPSFPDEPIQRFIPGTDSGTLSFFADTTFSRSLDELPTEDLIAILEFHLTPGRVNALNAEKPLAERSQEELVQLVQQEVVKPRVVMSYNLVESIFGREAVYAYAETVPNGFVEFYSWLNLNFLTSPQSSVPEYAGVNTAIWGSLWVIFITIIVALPIGVGAAIYLEEYATMVANPTLRRFNAIIQTNINNLAGVPSIIYGLLGLAVFVRALEVITSGTAFGATDPTTANGRTVLSAGLTMALLILPLIIINAQEAIRAVPQSLRQAGMGLGATKWQTIWSHVLPNAIPGILTGNILAVSRAVGETAPLVVIGASTFITVNPTSPFSKFTTLPIQIYQWTARPQSEFQHIAAAAIIVLLVLLLSLNAAAVLLRNKYSKRLI